MKNVLSPLCLIVNENPLGGVPWFSGRVLVLRSRGCWFKSHRTLRCVLERNTLSSAYYWFNPGRPEKLLTGT